MSGHAIPPPDPPCGISKPTLTIDEIKERSPTGISGPKKIIARPRAKSVISTYECSQFRTEFAADSPLEGDGFEPPVPRPRNGSFWWKREDF
jgi:hypothetical protein